jgi:uncharacterized membrane protein
MTQDEKVQLYRELATTVEKLTAAGEPMLVIAKGFAVAEGEASSLLGVIALNMILLPRLKEVFVNGLQTERNMPQHLKERAAELKKQYAEYLTDTSVYADKN